MLDSIFDKVVVSFLVILVLCVIALAVIVNFVNDRIHTHESSNASEVHSEPAAISTTAPSKPHSHTQSTFYDFIAYNLTNPIVPKRAASTNVVLQQGTRGMPLSYFVPSGFYDSVGFDWTSLRNLSSTAQGRGIAFTHITERMLQSWSVNLYDSAVRLIALGLFGDPESLGSEWLSHLWSVDRTVNIRAESPEWQYGGQTVNTGREYFFRAVAPQFALPYVNGEVGCVPNNFSGGFSSPTGCDNAPFTEQPGYLTWDMNDFRPISGENAWIRFVGPLQYAYLLNDSKIPSVHHPNVKAARDILSTVQSMQSAIGGLYWTASSSGFRAGTSSICRNLQGEISGPTDPTWCAYMMSVENNTSAYAGLAMLQEILNNEPTVFPTQLTILNTILTNIQNFFVNVAVQMNGITIETFDDTQPTLEIKPVIATSVYYPYAGGGAPVQQTLGNVFAVDVHTWGLSVFHQAVDEKYGIGTSWQLYQTVRKYGGTFENDVLIGCGYTYNVTAQVLSGEWSLGMLWCARILHAFYQDNAFDEQTEALRILAEDEKNIRQTMKSKLTSVFKWGENDFQPFFAQQPLRNHNRNVTAIKYADQSYAIPFGWNARPVPSMASTGWMVFDEFNYNPWRLGGTIK